MGRKIHHYQHHNRTDCPDFRGCIGGGGFCPEGKEREWTADRAIAGKSSPLSQHEGGGLFRLLPGYLLYWIQWSFAGMGDVLEKCGLMEVPRRLVGNLSKGYQQRVGIAQALVAAPEIVILDEPMNGLDPAAVVEMRDLILGLGGEHTVLLSSHRLQEVSVMCRHLTIIKEGRIVRTGAWEKMRKEFSGGKCLTLRLGVWKRELESLLEQKWGIEDIQVVSCEGGVQVCMVAPVGEDLRASLSRLMVEWDCGLLEIREDEPDLEDVFQIMTKKGTADYSGVHL